MAHRPLANVQRTPTWSLYRDEPVEHVLTVYEREAPYECHYECTICGGKAWVTTNQGLESFLENHDDCVKEIA